MSDDFVREIEEICGTVPLAFIIKAVKNHDMLVKALEQITRPELMPETKVDIARAALRHLNRSETQ